jgi:hypothetical protein
VWRSRDDKKIKEQARLVAQAKEEEARMQQRAIEEKIRNEDHARDERARAAARAAGLKVHC